MRTGSWTISARVLALLALIPACSSDDVGDLSAFRGTWKGTVDRPAQEMPCTLTLQDGAGTFRQDQIPFASTALEDDGTTIVLRAAGQRELRVTRRQAEGEQMVGTWTLFGRPAPVILAPGATEGEWTGTIQLAAAQATLAVRIEGDLELSAKWDYMDLEKEFANVAVDSVSVAGEQVRVVMDRGNYTLDAVREGDSALKGSFRKKLGAGDAVYPLVLRRISGTGSGYAYQRPVTLGDGWETSTLDAEGMDVTLLSDLVQRLQAGEFGAIHSMLMVRNGRLILEEYFKGYHRDEKQDIKGVSECIANALFGIALQREVLPGLNAKIGRFFPDHKAPDDDERRARITIQHLLSMSSGKACDDWDQDSPGNEQQMNLQPDILRFFLDLPMVSEPGEQFQYCRAGLIAAGAALAEAAGASVPEFAREHLFGPLGIRDYRWDFTNSGHVYFGGRFYLLPRDLAKLGHLYAGDGKWGDQQVLSPDWIRLSTQKRFDSQLLGGYGYLWWIERFYSGNQELTGFSANGAGGQKLIVLPRLKLVVVFTGGLPDSGIKALSQILARYVIPAVRSA